MKKTVLLTYKAGVHPALQAGIRELGVDLRDFRSHDELETGVIGCMIWFYDCLRRPIEIWSLRRKLRRAGIPLIAWNQDAPHYLNRAAWRLDLLDKARLLDIYATHTLIDATRNFADTVLYLPNAADLSKYHLHGVTLEDLRDPARYSVDVSFFGAIDGVRYKEMQARQLFFSALGDRLARQDLHFLFREAAGMSVDEQVGLIQRSRINLNFGASCDYGSPVASGLPERCYGIPACGGFLLCDQRTHARDDFAPGLDWAEFEGIDDCVQQISHWLDHFAEARDLAERCHRRVLATHTYAHRARRLVDTIEDWHAGKRGLIH